MRNDQNNASVLMEPTIINENCIFIPNCGGIVPAGNSLLSSTTQVLSLSPPSNKRTTAVKVSIAAKKISETAKSRRKTHYMKKLLQLKGDYCTSAGVGVQVDGGVGNGASDGVTATIEGIFSSVSPSMQNQAFGLKSVAAYSELIQIMGRTKTKQQQQQQQQFDLKVS